MFWYEDEIERLEKQKSQLTYNPKLLFYGSSSIAMWDSLYEDFNECKPVNLGFNGSTLAACVWFFDRILSFYHPDTIVLYAGDNDLGDGRHAEEVYIFYQQFIQKVRQQFGNVPTYFVSIKPSEARLDIIGRIKYANKIIETETRKDSNQHYINVFDKMVNKKGLPRKEFFKSDKLHLSSEGYQLWKQVIKASL
jgi:lysophospholipase L1-like esterase